MSDMKWQTKKVLITGGAGFIGSNLALRLSKAGANIEIVDNLNQYCGGNLFNLKEIEHQITIYKNDICSTNMESIVSDKDFIFHLAGQTGHLFSHQNPELDLKMNALSSLRLLEACRRVNNTARLIFSSTRQIFGEPQYLPVDENHPINPIDINGIHKFAAEQYFQMYFNIYGLKTCILRLTNTYGPRQSIKNNKLGATGWFINRAINNETISLVSGGTQIRDFLFVDDTVEALATAALSDKVYGKAFNLSGEILSLKDFALKLIKIIGHGNISEINATDEEKKIQLSKYYGSSDFFTSTTGWRSQVNIDSGLEETIKFYLQFKSYYI